MGIAPLVWAVICPYLEPQLKGPLSLQLSVYS